MKKTALMMAVMSLGLAAPALADDRQPNAEELVQIENTLKAEGFVRWDDIERDDDLWEVDDAYTADGAKFDLKLDDTYAVVHRKQD